MTNQDLDLVLDLVPDLIPSLGNWKRGIQSGSKLPHSEKLYRLVGHDGTHIQRPFEGGGIGAIFLAHRPL